MSGDQRAFERAMNSGHTAAWEQSWERAAQFYRSALEEFPQHPMALNSLALAMYEMKDYQQALVYYQKAAQAAPDDPLPFEKIARIYEGMGKTTHAVQASLKTAELHLKSRNVEKAIENWLRAIHLQPENIMARTRLAMVFERMGRKNEAAAEYLATASLMQHSGDLVKAMQVVEYVMQLVPENEDARRAMQRLRNNQPLPKPGRPRLLQECPLSALDTSDRQLPPAQADTVQPMDPVAEARRQAMSELAGLLFEQAEEALPVTRAPRKGLAALTRGAGGAPGVLQTARASCCTWGRQSNRSRREKITRPPPNSNGPSTLVLSHPAAFFNAGMLVARRNGQRALRYLQQSVHHRDYALASYLVMAQVHQQEGSPVDALDRLPPGAAAGRCDHRISGCCRRVDAAL
jgi:tetratricopeptide (TPR) repeat protein